VGFRWFVLRRAGSLGLLGWVRNLRDGSVEVVAKGLADAQSRLEETLRHGPPGAYVEEVDVADVPHESVDSKSFEIRH
jgi:acylphosphatase